MEADSARLYLPTRRQISGHPRQWPTSPGSIPLPNISKRRAPSCWRAGHTPGYDAKDSPRVAVINREFARKIFGSERNAVGRHFKLRDGSRVSWWVWSKMENICTSPEDVGAVSPHSASAHERDYPGSTLPSRSAATGGCHAKYSAGPDRGLPFFIETWDQQLDVALFPSRSHGVTGPAGNCSARA